LFEFIFPNLGNSSVGFSASHEWFWVIFQGLEKTEKIVPNLGKSVEIGSKLQKTS